MEQEETDLLKAIQEGHNGLSPKKSLKKSSQVKLKKYSSFENNKEKQNDPILQNILQSTVARKKVFNNDFKTEKSKKNYERLQKDHEERQEELQKDNKKLEDIAMNLQEYLETINATKIQSFLRGNKARKDLKRNELETSSATKIQSLLRGNKTRGDVNKLRTERKQKNATELIQRSFREHVARNLLKQQKKELETSSATHLQALFRGHNARESLNKQKNTATKLQTTYRGHLARRKLNELREVK